MFKITEKLSLIHSLADCFLKNDLQFFGLIIGLLILIGIKIWKGKRPQEFFKQDRNNLEDDEDESFVENRFVFRNLNPNQSVEMHRRQRSEAASAVLKKAANSEPMVGSTRSPKHSKGKAPT
ncbi:uncharacterized protein LOC108102099 [Drosophila ficusphila]|uniref:uncharacterized protein LOC108102099 n=1 Tax=Drosophila ficusphila TaxID=30025 RepID=UPI0007E843D7|nr:uncharacterized protein LOC108102099 [Drosophila ficusphila]